MVYQPAAGHANVLKRTAAILFVTTAVSACSSGAMRFTEGVPTTATAASQPVTAENYPVAQQQYPAQAYPGDTALQPAYVDNTATGSISRAPAPVQQAQTTASQPKFWQRVFRVPKPARDVGTSSTNIAVAAPAPLPPASQPFPAAPAGSIERAPMGDPVTRSASLPPLQPAAPAVDAMSTGSVAAAAPATGGTAVTARSGDTVRKLADRYGVSADRLAAANGLSAGATLAAGQTVVIPAFGAPASPVAAAPATQPAPAVAAAPAETSPSKVPVPGKKPSNGVAVLPQQPRVAENKPQTASNTAGGVYTVQSGDTLSAIARRHGTTAAAIRAANNMETGLIRVGQKLVVPGAGAQGQQVAAAQLPKGVDPMTTGNVSRDTQVTGYTPPKKPEIAVEEAAQQTAAAPDATGIGKMRWPVRGKVVSGFGDTRGPKKNDGLDIAVPEGTSVKAAENGVVIYAGDGLKDFGNTVLVRHENGLVTVYGHASEIKVARGETVRRGQEIARSGVSGNADTPKLHFEVRKDSAPVDPSSFLE
jgi:murein DD-endopeptidase MepM/ murein hydrolase activator NlpD